MTHNWTSTEISMMIMSVGATIVSLLVAVSKSRCTTIKFCGASCERDVIPISDLENQLQQPSEPRISIPSPPPPPPLPNRTPIANVAARVQQFNGQSN
jgi:hypothetical protein